MRAAQGEKISCPALREAIEAQPTLGPLSPSEAATDAHGTGKGTILICAGTRKSGLLVRRHAVVNGQAENSALREHGTNI